MQVFFTKMHGAGNDFVVVDDMDLSFPWRATEWLVSVASRRRGIGCDGVVLLQPSDDADIRMRFFNPDGSEVDMCGNALRCTAMFAYRHGLAGRSLRIVTRAGILNAENLPDGRVSVLMTPPSSRSGPVEIDLGSSVYRSYSVNTGVPHAVIEVEDLESLDVLDAGRKVRRHAEFSPAGTNVDFIHLEDDGRIRIRTYERGVEDETLACGTGVVASAVIMAERGCCGFPVDVLCASGDILRVGGVMSDGLVTEVTQTGPACVVYEGSLELPEGVVGGGCCEPDSF